MLSKWNQINWGFFPVQLHRASFTILCDFNTRISSSKHLKGDPDHRAEQVRKTTAVTPEFSLTLPSC